MRIPAIEELKLQIPDKRTRSSIDEVLSCFYSDNLRGAIVMLYVTVISDLYYKICDLADIYNDKVARDIKTEIKKKWTDHPKSAQWETDIIDLCHKHNRILTSVSYTHATKLQAERHLCAHPVIDDISELYHPTASSVQGFIIDMLREILCRPAFLGRKFFESFTNDIENHANTFATDKELVSYIEEKYLKKINNKDEEYDLFKRLWRLVFKLVDDRSRKNRRTSCKVLSRLYERNEQHFNTKLSEEPDYYANNTCLDDDCCLYWFTRWANAYRAVYNTMPISFKTEYCSKVKTTKDIEAIAFCTTTNDDIVNYANNFSENISTKTAKYIYKFLKKNGYSCDAKDFLIELFGNSLNYDQSKDYFTQLVSPILVELSECQLKRLIEVCSKNGQISGRYEYPYWCAEIKRYMDKKNPTFDYSVYPNFELDT